jgi:hypothetical protein
MPQFHRAEIEIDGERLGYALVEGDVRSGELRQRDAARCALAMAGKLGLAAAYDAHTLALAERLWVEFMYGSAICLLGPSCAACGVNGKGG